MIELRKIIQNNLKIACLNVFFQSAPETASFPYLVYDIINIHSDGEDYEQAVIDVDGWSNNKDTTELENMMKDVETVLNKNSFTLDTKTATFFIDDKKTVPSEDARLRRRKYTFQARIFESSELGDGMITLKSISNQIEALKVDMIRPKNPVKLMCLYYGYPNNINMVYNNEIASQIYSKYDIVVLGDGLEHPDHIIYSDTVEIIRLTKEKHRSIEIFGYVPMGQGSTSQKLSANTMKTSIDEWITAGATGIFLDEYGFDYFVSRESQNEIVKYCHDHGVNVIANSWNYDWVFSSKDLYLDWIDYHGNPGKLAPEINANDYFLFENMFSNIDATLVQKVADQYRLQTAVAYRQEVKDEYNMSYYKRFRTKSIALDGIMGYYPEREKLFTLGYLGSAVLGIDGYGASGVYWGAADADFKHYNPSKLPELLEETKHFTNIKHTGEGESLIVYSQYDAEFPNATLRLLWAPDVLDPNDPAKGTRKVLWNGIEKTTV